MKLFIMEYLAVSQRCIYTLAAVLLLAIATGSTYLTLKSEDVWLNEKFKMTCTLSPRIDDSFTRWKVSYYTYNEIIVFRDNCLRFGLFNSSNYDVDCSISHVFSVTVLRASLEQHLSSWYCYYGGNFSNTIQIDVKVQLHNVTLIYKNSEHTGENTIDAKEFSIVTAQCKTSFGRPLPNITWFKYTDGNATQDMIAIENTTMTNTSTLNYNISRNDNHMRFGCVAGNRKNFFVTSGNLTMNVLYSPDGPTIIGYIKDQKYKVILDSNGTLTCNVSGGNPTTVNLTWSCFNSKRYIHNGSKQMSTIIWTALDTTGGRCSCNMVHTTGTKTAFVLVEVLYSPRTPKIILSKQSMTGSIDVILNSSFALNCSALSNPEANILWNLPNNSVSEGHVVHIHNIQMSMKGNITCIAKNEMRDSDGFSKNGSNSTSVEIQILYPPQIKQLENASAVEGFTFNVSCPVIPGNPSLHTVQWKRKGNDQLTSDAMLLFPNVSRHDEMVYICIVNYTMKPTGDTKVVGEISKRFYLTVFFPAKISVFAELEKNEFKNAIVVNETGDVSFICTAEANPASNMTISSPQNQLIAEGLSNNTLHHTLQNTSYLDAGEYICVGRNNYTRDQDSSSKLILIVKSPPRLSSDNAKDGKVTTTLKADVTLQFTARSYLDEPNRTMFIWFKANKTLENHGSKIIMSSHKLQSNLSIVNITQDDFGQYGVNVSNSVGQYIHLFELVAKDKPETPKNFAYINDSVTDTSVTLNWMPGFYGGYSQTFFLMFKRNIGRQWRNTSIEDNGNIEMNFTLFGLISMTEYQVKMFSRNREGDSDFTENIHFTTKAPVSTPIESHSSSTVAIVAGSISASVLILSTAGIVVLVFIYRKRNNKGDKSVYQNIPISGHHITTQRKHDSMEARETLFEGLQDVDDVPVITNERTEYCNSPDMIEKIDRIKVTELLTYVSGRGEESFEADYQKLPTELQKPCTFARKPENIALNRYNGIYPYDHSRVKLHGEPDFFINACYINGYQSSKSYIASLGPTAKTTKEFITFWKMVWSERVDVIVMLTNLREPSGMKCEKYWPEGCATIWYGDTCVTNKTTECFAEYTIRQFSVSKEEERRSLTHLHYTAWPDKTVPEDVTSLIEFRQKMKNTPTSSEGPVVVHCSAGIGRTGTLIALDRLIEEGQDQGSINVFECVKDMREQRVKMVQTFEQYMYIYKALVNALTFNCETIPVETFNEYVDETNNNMYSMMFQQLRQSVETDSKADVEARLKNEQLTKKNRLGADIPGSRFRAMLYLNRTDEGSEYINAVYINSFVKRDYFIAAQSPLPCTVADFLTMVYQEDCSCIATMEDLKDPGMTVGQYLPDDKKTLTVGNFKVSSSGLETKHNYVVRKMKIKYSGKFDSGEKIIYHFQYTKWMTGHDTPMHAKEFVHFVNEVKEYANELGEDRSHVIVHCLKANERSGLFCALATLMEKIKLERQVNILNTLRHLRTRRQTAITSMEQLKFCFQATSEYIKMNMLG